MPFTCFCAKCGAIGQDFPTKSLFKLHQANVAREEAGTAAKDTATKILHSTLASQHSRVSHSSQAIRGPPIPHTLPRQPKLNKRERHAATDRALRNLEVASQRLDALGRALKNRHDQPSLASLQEMEEVVARVRRDIDRTTRRTDRITEAKDKLKRQLDHLEGIYQQYSQSLSQQEIQPVLYTASSCKCNELSPKNIVNNPLSRQCRYQQE
jgi:cell division septum initiation protein DivIVA